MRQPLMCWLARSVDCRQQFGDRTLAARRAAAGALPADRPNEDERQTDYLLDPGTRKRRNAMKILSARLVLGLLALWLFQVQIGGEAFAACSGSSPTWAAASAERTEVQDCVNKASSGDRINVPAGTATWSSAITLPAKDLEIIGATVISCTGGSSSR